MNVRFLRIRAFQSEVLRRKRAPAVSRACDLSLWSESGRRSGPHNGRVTTTRNGDNDNDKDDGPVAERMRDSSCLVNSTEQGDACLSCDAATSTTDADRSG